MKMNQRPVNSADILKRKRNKTNQKNPITIEPSANDKIIKNYETVKLIIRSLGHKSCYISDESLVSDFLPCFGKNLDQKREEILKKSKKKIRVDIKPKDKILTVAKRILQKNKEKNNDK